MDLLSNEITNLTNKPIAIICDNPLEDYALNLSNKFQIPVISSIDSVKGSLYLKIKDNTLYLTDCEQEFCGDFSQKLKRLTHSNLSHELLIKAVKIKGKGNDISIIDATAGMGEDSLLLAAYGFNVTMCEYNPFIAELLRNTLMRAENNESLTEIIKKMSLLNSNSIDLLSLSKENTDVVYLDPMFPERQKSALVKKKFQLIHKLEMPCNNEEEILSAALSYANNKVVVKRPAKGSFLAGKKPNYSIEGSSIRYDCYMII